MSHSQPCKTYLLLIAGLPASGKTKLARLLAKKFAGVHINSDAVRKELSLRGHYDPDSKMKVYQAMISKAESALQQGGLTIVDSTFYKNSLRQPWIDLAEKYGACCRFIEIIIPDDTARERLQKKREDSEADWSVYQALKAQWEPLDIPHLVLNSNELSLDEMAAAASTYLSEYHDPGTNH